MSAYISPKQSAFCPECRGWPQQERGANRGERLCSSGHSFTLAEARAAEQQWQGSAEAARVKRLLYRPRKDEAAVAAPNLAAKDFGNCVNCNHRIYRTGRHWYHQSSGGMSCALNQTNPTTNKV